MSIVLKETILSYNAILRKHIYLFYFSHISTIIWNWINGFVGGVTLTISVGAFLTQFLDWWYNRDGTRAKFMSMPAPPPPSKVSHTYFYLYLINNGSVKKI